MRLTSLVVALMTTMAMTNLASIRRATIMRLHVKRRNIKSRRLIPSISLLSMSHIMDPREARDLVITSTS